MPLINAGITAKSIEVFKKCEEALKELNGMIQTLNGKDISVTIQPSMIGGGIVVTPVVNKIDALRIFYHGNDQERNFWVDYEMDKKRIAIRAKEGTVFLINLEPEEK